MLAKFPVILAFLANSKPIIPVGAQGTIPPPIEPSCPIVVNRKGSASNSFAIGIPNNAAKANPVIVPAPKKAIKYMTKYISIGINQAFFPDNLINFFTIKFKVPLC